MATVKVDPKYYRHIIGKQGATIGRLRDYKVRVRLPDSDRGDAFSDEIVIEGDPVGVEKAKLEIQQLVERLVCIFLFVEVLCLFFIQLHIHIMNINPIHLLCIWFRLFQAEEV